MEKLSYPNRFLIDKYEEIVKFPQAFTVHKKIFSQSNIQELPNDPDRRMNPEKTNIFSLKNLTGIYRSAYNLCLINQYLTA